MLQLGERHPEHRLEVADKSVDVALARDLVDDVLVVVVAQAAAQLLVVHLGFVLAGAPAAGDLLGVDELELPLTTGPRDAVLTVSVREQLKQKLPQLDGAGPWGREGNTLVKLSGHNGRFSQNQRLYKGTFGISGHNM